MAVNTKEIHAEIAIKQGKTPYPLCKGKDDDVFWLCYGNNEFFLEIADGIHRFTASML
jgi:hypothetical protein